MKNESHVCRGGIGLGGLLGTTFIVLKLTKVIDWSWWWVLSPFWIPVAILFLIASVIVIVFFLLYVFGQTK